MIRISKQFSINNILLIPYLIFCFSCRVEKMDVPDIPANEVIPTPLQAAYHEMEFIGFIHFSINTFTDKEWGYGDEPADIFMPSEFDAGQWAAVAEKAGMKELILTAKHHDGFCLWPSKHTDHSVKNSRWREGHGDVVREFTDACRCHGLKVGLYLSPWDRNHRDYGSPGYIDYYRDQLRELLTDYGEISEIWLDGANGGSGWYGGADESRRIDRETYYQWPETWDFIKSIQPDVMLFSDAGPDIRWIGNERGFAGETNWSTIDSEGIVVGGADQAYLNTGDPRGKNWVVPLCDTSIRPGWFYHQSQDSQVKSLQELLDVYYKSVGRNGVLLLNIPPDKRGLIHEHDVSALEEFRLVLDETFRTNLAAGRVIKADNFRLKNPKFSPDNIVDGDPDSYWACDDDIRTAVLEIDLGRSVLFDRILIQEPIRFGQRIASFEVEAHIGDEWVQIAEGTTIGHKRILRISPVKTDGVKLIIRESNNLPALSNFGLYKASDREKGL